MRLTAQTDYALRILLHATLADRQNAGLLSIASVSEYHRIPRNNVMKVVNLLANAGLLETVRGRGGGFKISKDAPQRTLGDVVRMTEPCMAMANCAGCILRGNCGLTGYLQEAAEAFLSALDKRTLAQAADNSSLVKADQQGLSSS